MEYTKEEIEMGIDFEVTKEMMVQYEKIRRSGLCNMFGYFCVHRVANLLGFKALASVSYENYKILLMNFCANMKKFGISQTEEL